MPQAPYTPLVIPSQIVSPSMPAAVIATIISAIASAGASAYGAKKVAKASTQAAALTVDASVKAAELQAKATEEALRFSKEQWSDAKGVQQPYLTIGKQAVGTLAQLMGIAPEEETNTYGAPVSQLTRPVASPVASPPGPSATDDFERTLQGWYTRYLGRPATPEEMDSHRGNPGGINGVLSTIMQSPEYLAKTRPPAPRSVSLSPGVPPTTLGAVSRVGPRAFSALPGLTGPRTAGLPPGMVLLRAPTGQQKAVAEADVQTYLALGATRVPPTTLASVSAIPQQARRDYVA